MNSEEIGSLYQEILRFAWQMLDAAKASDWRSLIELEQKRGKLFDELMSCEQGGSPEREFQDRKAALIRQILEVDGETKALAEAWVRELQGILDSVSTEQKLQKIYDTL